jgi:hypothetical protein
VIPQLAELSSPALAHTTPEAMAAIKKVVGEGLCWERAIPVAHLLFVAATS